MDFYKILQEIMNEKDLTIPEVARACGLTDSTVRSIIDREQKKIALNVAFKISTGLCVSLDRLNGEREKSPAPAEAKAEDSVRKRLITNYDDMNDEGRERLAEISDDMIAGGRYKKPNQSYVGKEA